MVKPRISVVMSVYKEPVEWLRQSIESILHQTYNDFEYIIICDNPEYHNGQALLKEYAKIDGRIKLIFNDCNIGLTKSLNKGISHAQGEYIARMDADDIAIIQRLEKQVTFMNSNPTISVCGSCVELFGDRSGVINMPERSEDMYLFLSSPFAHPSVMIRKDCMNGLKYDENYLVSQDYALWVEMEKNNLIFYNIQECLLKYRVSESQLSSATKKNILQKSVSRKLRRDAFNTFCIRTSINNPIGYKIITYATISDVRHHVTLPSSVMEEFIFYLYCSVDENFISKFINIIISGDVFRLKIKSTLRILKYSLLKVDFKIF